MPTFQNDGRILYYESAGDGAPVLLIHGDQTSGRTWAKQVEALKDAFRVLTLDLYGYGRSPFTGEKRIDHADDVRALLDHLTIPAAHIVGISMGSEVALTFALDHPDRTTSLALVSPGLEGYDYPEEAFVWFGSFIQMARSGEFAQTRQFFIDHAFNSSTAPLSDELRGAILALMSEYDYRHYTDDTLLWKGAEVAPAQRLGELKCPLLVVIPEGDAAHVADIGRVIAEAVPQTTLVTIPQSGHLVNMQQPEQFNAALTRFLIGVV